MSAAAKRATASTASSARLLADVEEIYGRKAKDREPVADRLAAAIGREEFAEQLVAVLSKDALDRTSKGDETVPVLARIDAETSAALQRLVALFDIVPPSPRRRFRVTKLAGALATWAMVAFLVVDAFHLA